MTKQTDILLTYPSESIKIFDPMIPLGISSIASVLKRAGYSVTFIDFNRYDGNFTKDLLALNPSIVGIGGTTPTRKGSFLIAAIIKKILNNTPVVYGGVHASFTAEDTLKNVPDIDYIIKGEGEFSFLKFCDIYFDRSNEDIRNIPGLCFRENGKIIQNKPQRIENLDELPMPERFYDEISYSLSMEFTNQEADFLVTSRGCPVTCTFCSASTMFPGGIRFRSIENIEKEVHHILKHKKVSAIKLFDSTFTANKEHTLAFCKIIKKYNLLWECELRVDTVDFETLKAMKDAGCYYVDIGVETVNDDLLRKIGKKITVAQIRQVLEWCNQIGIKTKVFFIFGLLDQSYKSCNLELNFMKQQRDKIDHYATTIGVRVYPGTPLEKQLYKRSILPDNFSWANYKPSIKNYLIGEFGDVYIHHQKDFSVFKKMLIIIRLLFQGTVLTPDHIKKLIINNLSSLLNLFTRKVTLLFKKRA